MICFVRISQDLTRQPVKLQEDFSVRFLKGNAHHASGFHGSWVRKRITTVAAENSLFRNRRPILEHLVPEHILLVLEHNHCKRSTWNGHTRLFRRKGACAE